MIKMKGSELKENIIYKCINVSNKYFAGPIIDWEYKILNGNLYRNSNSNSNKTDNFVCLKNLSYNYFKSFLDSDFEEVETYNIKTNDALYYFFVEGKSIISKHSKKVFEPNRFDVKFTLTFEEYVNIWKLK